jgi:hypothetical protein
MADRNELDRLLTALEARMPALAGEEYFDDDTFWPRFWRLARPIEQAAFGPDHGHVLRRLSALLGAWGLVMSDEQGHPLDDLAA